MIQTDASSTGLGAVLLQNEQPVAFVSRALTDTETRWAQIEKECLVIVFSVEKFEHYVYGRSSSATVYLCEAYLADDGAATTYAYPADKIRH